jgi:hypothetical protein
MANDKVHTLAVVPKYNAQVVKYLEILLEDAKAGKITEMCCVTKLSDGQYEHCWTGCEDLYQLVGQLERLVQLTLRRMDT